jgi:16S rRNA (adenine1518-N6/adenine1519-N6)-dimethyltransferase
MNLNSPKIIKELLAKYETRPSKGLGQNFLIDKNVLDKIIDVADIKPNDFILEVGPGLGTLTQELATRLRQGFGEAKKNAGQVIAIEKDKVMLEILKETLEDFENVEIIQGDILKINPADYKLQTTNYKLVANIPYYLTSPLIRKFLEIENKPDFMVLMLQKEVAQRICAKPPHMSLLAVSVQFYAEPKIVSYVSKNCFYPTPKIDSAIIKITPCSGLGEVIGAPSSADLFFKIVKAGFSQPRKQLAGNLSKSLEIEKKEVEVWLFKSGIKPTQRAETLSVEDWKNLSKTIHKA